MPITITVNVQCQARTQRYNTQCTRQATTYDGPTDDAGVVQLVDATYSQAHWTNHMGGRRYTTTNNIQGVRGSYGFVCNTHARQGRNGRV